MGHLERWVESGGKGGALTGASPRGERERGHKPWEGGQFLKGLWLVGLGFPEEGVQLGRSGGAAPAGWWAPGNRV